MPATLVIWNFGVHNIVDVHQQGKRRLKAKISIKHKRKYCVRDLLCVSLFTLCKHCHLHCSPVTQIRQNYYLIQW